MAYVVRFSCSLNTLTKDNREEEAADGCTMDPKAILDPSSSIFFNYTKIFWLFIMV